MTPPPAAAALAAALADDDGFIDACGLVSEGHRDVPWLLERIAKRLAASGWQLVKDEPSAVGVTREGEGLRAALDETYIDVERLARAIHVSGAASPGCKVLPFDPYHKEHDGKRAKALIAAWAVLDAPQDFGTQYAAGEESRRSEHLIEAMKPDVDEYRDAPCAECDRPRRLHSEQPASPMHDWHPFREGEQGTVAPEPNHYDWFMPATPTAAVDEYLDDFEVKLREALTDPYVHDMAQLVLPLIAAYRAVIAGGPAVREAGDLGAEFRNRGAGRL